VIRLSDEAALLHNVNAVGTQNVINACLSELAPGCPPRLVLTSSVSAVCDAGGTHITDGHELDIPWPQQG